MSTYLEVCQVKFITMQYAEFGRHNNGDWCRL
jgi:hypothetical protein